jgi:cation:H+ antiporter
MPEFSLIAALLGGLVIMALAGDFLVSGAVVLARKLGVSPLLAGIFIVGFGTSAPEMLVSLDAAIQGRPGLALGNIVGSNIANIWLVLAVPAIIAPMVAGGFGQRRAMFAMLGATALWIGLTSANMLTPNVGLLFLLLLLAYSGYTLLSTRKAMKAGVDVGMGAEDAKISLNRALVYVPLGVAGLVLGANLIVDGGIGIAEFYQVDEELIGLTLLAVGTSLPEIGAGVAAALRKKGDVLFGNVVGSNLFNILGAGGIIAFFDPPSIAKTFIQYDYWAMGAAALTLALIIMFRARIGRLLAILMLLIYALYIYGLVNGFDLLAIFTGQAT